MDEPLSQQSVLNKASEDKFLLVLNIPSILQSIVSTTRTNSKINTDSIQFSVEGSIVPPISVPSVFVPYSGQGLQITSKAREEYPKNRVRFTIDNRFNNYWILWKWLNVLNDAKKSIANADNLIDTGVIPSLHNYQTDMVVFGMDEYNNRAIQFKYHKAFITSLGGIDYDYQKSGQIVSTFEFAYSQLQVDLL